jgi:hypothetical protein
VTGDTVLTSLLLTLTIAACLTLPPVGLALLGDEPAEAGRATVERAGLSATWAASADRPFPGSLRGTVTVPEDAGSVMLRALITIWHPTAGRPSY